MTTTTITANCDTVPTRQPAPARLFQIWACENDRNGNPRRVTMVYAATGGIVAELDQGYRGNLIPRGAVQLPTVEVSPKVYKEAVIGEAYRAMARRYLDQGYTTAIEDIGHDARKNTAKAKEFARLVRLSAMGNPDLGKAAEAIWAIEAQRAEGIAWRGEKAEGVVS